MSGRGPYSGRAQKILRIVKLYIMMMDTWPRLCNAKSEPKGKPWI